MNAKPLRAARTVAAAAGLAAALWAAVPARPESPGGRKDPSASSIRVDPGTGAVDVAGLGAEALAALAAFKGPAEERARLFSLRVAPADGAPAGDRPAVLGSWAVEGDVLRFRPRYPLARGVRYLAVFDPSSLPSLAGVPAVRQTLLLPKKSRPAATAVAHVYPSADRLPENLLKFYLHFSAPMSRGGVYRYIHLLGPGGKEVELPFLELDEELWDKSGTRLTLLLDPGRIKRGLKPREEVGPVLEEGKAYTLVIDRAWPDAEGEPLREAHRKTFTAGPPDDVPPDPQKWKVQPPPADTREPLAVTFPEPLDHALLQRLLEVTDGRGRSVAGQVWVRPGEAGWEFTPTEPWRAGGYRLVIDTRLEDLAGNRIGRPFEVDVFRPIEREVKAETVALPFTVAPAR
jgi:hypothetical protein